jgi:hypothetical protein
MKDFPIDQVSWHTLKPRNYEFDTTIIYRYFKSVINYLESNNLTVKPLNEGKGEITEDTRIMASDLTEEGFQVVKAAYRKWIDKVVDGKISPDDYKLFDKALKKIREAK